MSAVRFSAQTRPVWWASVIARKPPCMSAEAWQLTAEGWVQESSADSKVRVTLERGKLPNYCAGCTSQYRGAMMVRSLCYPPPGVKAPRV